MSNREENHKPPRLRSASPSHQHPEHRAAKAVIRVSGSILIVAGITLADIYLKRALAGVSPGIIMLSTIAFILVLITTFEDIKRRSATKAALRCQERNCILELAVRKLRAQLDSLGEPAAGGLKDGEATE